MRWVWAAFLSPDSLNGLQLGLWTLEESAVPPHCFVEGIPGLSGELYSEGKREGEREREREREKERMKEKD